MSGAPLLPLLASALTMGLLGSAHCVGMCGGVAAACGASVDRALPASRKRAVEASFHLGRLASYAGAGAVAGTLGLGVGRALPASELQWALRLGAGVLLALAGLTLLGVGPARVLEKGGRALWRKVEPLAGKFLPVRTFSGGLSLGLLWGAMPCGLLYTALASALLAGGPLGGALTMAAFGLGTVPALAAMPALSRRFDLARSLPARALAGALLLLSGAWNVGLAARGLRAQGEAPACHHAPAPRG